ncbi:MAG: porin family protein [Chlorobiaceae bacterium]|nr:porin family protein [Chlorobiaceae bacterium]
MKKLLLSLLVAGLFAVPSLASASTSPYVSLSGGLGLMNDSDGTAIVTYKTGYLVNGAVGLKSDYYRLEAEVGYHNNTVETWDGVPPGPLYADEHVAIWSFMANGYVDYDMKDSGVSPYIMGGIGYASVTDSWTTASYSDGVFAWQIGAGVGIKAGNKATVDIGYRYFATSDPVFDGEKITISKHNIIAGVRFDL